MSLVVGMAVTFSLGASRGSFACRVGRLFNASYLSKMDSKLDSWLMLTSKYEGLVLKRQVQSWKWAEESVVEEAAKALLVECPRLHDSHVNLQTFHSIVPGYLGTHVITSLILRQKILLSLFLSRSKCEVGTTLSGPWSNVQLDCAHSSNLYCPIPSQLLIPDSFAYTLYIDVAQLNSSYPYLYLLNLPSLIKLAATNDKQMIPMLIPKFAWVAFW